MTATAIADGNGNGNGQWQLQRQWTPVMAMAAATETAMTITIAMAKATVAATMMLSSQQLTQGGLPLCVPAMCSAVAGATPCLPPPPGHKGVSIAQHCAMGVPLQRVFASFQGGGILRAHHGFFLIFFNYMFSLLINPLFPHTNLVPQEPRQPIDSLPWLLLYFLSR